MYNRKNDSLVDSVKAVMEQNELHRRVEAAVNEHFGIATKKALPHELHAEYDAVLAEAKKCAMEEQKPLSPKQKAIMDVNKNNKIDAHDLKLKRAGLEEDSEQLDEKAKSEQQQKFFGLVRAIQKGKAHGSAKAEKAAEEMPVKSVRDYAKTKHEGLPKKVDEEAVFEEIYNNLAEQLAYVYENYDEATFQEYVDSLTEEQLEILGLNEAQSWSDLAGDVYARGKAAVQNYLGGNAKAANKTLDNRFTNKEISGMGGRYKDSSGKTPTAQKSSVNKPTVSSTMTKKTTSPGVNKPAAQTKRVPGAAAAAAQKRIGYETKSAKTTPGQMMNTQVKESFESFLRNRFLKG